MLVSVVIPTYNRAALLLRAVNSVLNQTHGDTEVLVVDDGSTDNTADVLKGINDPRLKYFLINNGGAPTARNVGLSKATGEFITFLDSDDEYYPEKIERQLEVFKTSKVPNLGVVSCGRHDFRDGKLYFAWIPQYRGNITEQLLSKKRVGAGTPFLMIKRDVVDRGILFDPQMPAGQDFDFLVRVCLVFNFDFSPYHLVKVYHHTGERVYNPSRALEATELQFRKYHDLICSESRILESFVIRYADLSFTYGDREKSIRLIKEELVRWSIRRSLWFAYFKTFKSARSRPSLAVLKMLRMIE